MPEEEIELYFGIVAFSLQNSMYSLSWTEWKPKGFYPFLEEHLLKVFGAQAKNARQAKTKDQNLKTKYFVKPSKKLDILDLAMKKLV